MTITHVQVILMIKIHDVQQIILLNVFPNTRKTFLRFRFPRFSPTTQTFLFQIFFISENSQDLPWLSLAKLYRDLVSPDSLRPP